MQKPVVPRISDDELMKLIDGIMKDEDKNADGYIDTKGMETNLRFSLFFSLFGALFFIRY